MSDAKGILWYRLKKRAYSSFYGLLDRQLYSPEFLGGYAMSMLSCLHLIDLSDPYWTRKEVRHRLNEICRVYQRIRSRELAFGKNHFPNTVAIFRKKKAPDLLLLHTIFIKHMICQFSVKQTSYRNLVKEIIRYCMESGIRFRFSKAQLKETYFQLKEMPELREYGKLEKLKLEVW